MWYEGDDRVLTIGSDSFSDSDMLAGIPTYEDILALDPEMITVGGLSRLGGIFLRLCRSV